MLINFARKFSKQYTKVDSKIKKAFDNRLSIFKADPFNSLLNNHSLTGQFVSKRSINITGDWRAIYSQAIDDSGNQIITFELIGTHSELYG